MSWLAHVPGTGAWNRRRLHRLCRETLDRIQELVDEEVPSPRRAAVLLEHVRDCPPCAREADAVRELKDAIRRTGCVDDPGMVARLTELAERLPDSEP